MFINPVLKTSLQILESQVIRIIELQKKEDQVPNPPNFVQVVEDYQATAISKITDSMNACSDDNIGDEFDYNKMIERKTRWYIKKILDKLEEYSGGIKPPDKIVTSFPFKTNEGRIMEDCCRRISNCCLNIDSGIATNSEAREVKDKMKRCLARIDSFLDFTNIKRLGDPEAVNTLVCQYHFIFRVHGAIMIAESNIDTSQNIALFKALWRVFILWVEFIWIKLKKKLHRK